MRKCKIWLKLGNAYWSPRGFKTRRKTDGCYFSNKYFFFLQLSLGSFPSSCCISFSFSSDFSYSFFPLHCQRKEYFFLFSGFPLGAFHAGIPRLVWASVFSLPSLFLWQLGHPAALFADTFRWLTGRRVFPRLIPQVELKCSVFHKESFVSLDVLTSASFFSWRLRGATVLSEWRLFVECVMI